MELRSRFVSVNGIMTHYSESGGDGPVIVAAHGGGPGASGEAGMAALMRHIPSEYRVIALDSVGGFGRTDPRAPTPYGLQSRVDHLAAFVDAIGLERFTLLGNSQGAWVAARYAITHPDRIERLVLIGTMTIAMAMGLSEEQTPGMQAFRGYDGSREAMRRLLEGLVHDRATITDELVELRYAAASRPGAMDSFAAASRGTRHLQTDPVLRTQFDMREALPKAKFIGLTGIRMAVWYSVSFAAFIVVAPFSATSWRYKRMAQTFLCASTGMPGEGHNWVCIKLFRRCAA
mgnify:CR=1 FL=1